MKHIPILRSLRSWSALCALAASGCSELDVTRTFDTVAAPGLPAADAGAPTGGRDPLPDRDRPPASDASAPMSSADAAASGSIPGDAARPDAGAGSTRGTAAPRCELGGPSSLPPDAGGGDCLLEAEWTLLQIEGPPGCQALSSAFEARWFRPQGGGLAALDPDGAPFAAAGSTLERLRFCSRPVGALSELWRFEESLELGAPLPESCPSEPFQARYEYVEHGEVGGTGLVFGVGQEAACRFEACVRFSPRGGEAAASPPQRSEAACYGSSGPFDPTHTQPLGAPCSGDECAAGTFCSLERPDGSCAPLGGGTCQPAPPIETCSAESELVCGCYRTTPLPETNRCRERARGSSTRSCG